MFRVFYSIFDCLPLVKQLVSVHLQHYRTWMIDGHGRNLGIHTTCSSHNWVWSI